MKQAKLLDKKEFKRLIAVIEAHRHSERNKIIFYLSFFAGLRAIEIASLKINDVVNGEYVVNNEIVLEAHMTKGSERSVVILSKVLQKHLQDFIDSHRARMTLNTPLIRSQKSKSFSPVTNNARGTSKSFETSLRNKRPGCFRLFST